MKAIKSIACMFTLGLLTLAPAQAEDTDIFLVPPSSSGSTNIMVVLDSAGSINAQMMDIDGTAKKTYTVVGNVLKALLDPANLSIKRTVFPASSIITDPVTGCSKPAGTTSTCTCASFGYEVDSSNTANCKLPTSRATELYKLVESASLGVTLFTGTNSNGSGSQKGGYVAFTVRPMDTTNRGELKAKLADVPTGNTSMYASAMNEVYRYFKNMNQLAGFEGTTAFSTSALIGYDRRSCGKLNPSGICNKANDKYSGPIVDNSCTNAIIFIGPGSPANGAVEKDDAAFKALAGVNPTIINAGSKDDSNLFDEYAKFFASTDLNPAIDGVQPLATYTIITEDPDKKIDADARLLMQSAAKQGGGEFYVASNAVDFLDAFVAVLSKVQAVNTAFAAVSLPVSVNVRGTNLNQVYVGMFRPDANANPRWFGNLKEYQLAYDSTTNDVFLASADGTTRAETSSGSLLADNATSFWTHASSFWNFAPSGTPKTGNDLPDGPVVEKGGAAQMAREQYSDTTKQDTRKVFTCIGCSSTATALVDSTGTEATAFKIGNTSLTEAMLGLAATATTERNNIINWCRGQDLQNENNTTLAPDASTTDVRASLYGDVLHSRPAVINYNRTTTCSSTDNNDVYIFYGANDGFFKATKGGDNAVATNGGKEQWSFIPEEHFGKLKRLYDNLPEITASEPKPYFVDGPVGSYIEYATTACTGQSIRKVSKAILFLSMRRGGRFIYALDVTDPVAPKFLWKISNATTGFGELGDTWSEPKSAKVDINGTLTPVVIFGGGYDKAVEDIPNTSITAANATGVTTSTTINRTMGRAVFIVNATTGALIWRGSNSSASCAGGATCKAITGMDYAIPSDIAVIDRDFDGDADRLYVGDTGANLWRINIGDPSPANWDGYKLAVLNGARSAASTPAETTESAASARRKFLYMPDVVAAPDYDMIMVGSGDREQPFDTSVINRFYAIRDKNDATLAAVTDTSQASTGTFDLVRLTAADLAGGLSIPAERRGWVYTLTNPGEKIVSSPVTLNGISYFNTNRPTPGLCAANLGEARIYALDYLTGKAPVYTLAGVPSAYTVVKGGGYLPTGVPAVVDVGGKLREVLIVGTKVSQDIGVVQLGRRVRTYWFQGIDQ